MTPKQLTEALDRFYGPRKRKYAAIELGVSPGRLRRMETGVSPIPGVFDLAMAAKAYDLPPWPIAGKTD